MANQVNEWLCALTREDEASRLAYESLYETYYKPVFFLAVSITGDVSMAEDIAQEVFITLKKQAGKFYPDSSGRAWIFAITRNIARYFLRACRSRQNGEEYGEASVEFEKRVLDGMVISKALEQLNSAEYKTVLLHVFSGFSLKEIAENTDTPYGTVLWRYHSARKKLRGYYEGSVGVE